MDISKLCILIKKYITKMSDAAIVCRRQQITLLSQFSGTDIVFRFIMEIYVELADYNCAWAMRFMPISA